MWTNHPIMFRNYSDFDTAQLRKLTCWCLRHEGMDPRGYLVQVIQFWPYRQHRQEHYLIEPDGISQIYCSPSFEKPNRYYEQISGLGNLYAKWIVLALPELPVLMGREIARVLIHEIGHNRGLMHENMLDVSKLVIAELPIDLQKFYIQENANETCQ